MSYRFEVYYKPPHDPGREATLTEQVLYHCRMHGKAAWMPQEKLEVVCTFNRKHFSRLEGIRVLVPAKK